jgi:hypothetical protein
MIVGDAHIWRESALSTGLFDVNTFVSGTDCIALSRRDIVIDGTDFAG